ncbi:MAG: hypothetical protein SOI56_06130 [Eubacteriales bacterium]|jgi:hypothetical protein
MKEERVTVDELAGKLNQFGYDFDPYGYADSVDSMEEGFAQIRGELLKGNLSGYREYLQEVAEEKGEFAQEAEELLDLMDRYENRGRLSRQEKQSILDRIDELSRKKPALEKGKAVPAKEAER